MPVHNALPFLDESITSILGQTLTEFEFVIYDDGSTDGSTEVLREWSRKESRIRLFESNTRLGLSGSSNAVVSKARAAIVARMDADDISHPDRLKRQWEIIDNHPEIAVVGTLCVGIDEVGREVRPRDRWRLVGRSAYIPFPHGSVMFRRDVFDQVGGYARGTERGEEQVLFARMLARGSVVTLPDILYRYRYHSRNATLLNGPVNENHSETYLLGAMRLLAGHPPRLLRPLLAQKLRWNAKTLIILASAIWGEVSPPSLRFFLRLSIRARDFLAGLRVKDGRPYEWRSR